MQPLRYVYVEPRPSQDTFLGKELSYRDEQLKKEPRVAKGALLGRLVECEDMGEFHRHIQQISVTEKCALILGEPRGVEPGEEFLILPKALLKKGLGKSPQAPDETAHGVRELDGVKTMARLKANFEPSRLVLLDYDPNDRTPPECIYRSAEEYVAALCELFPVFGHAGLVITSSSSAGIVSPSGRYLTDKDTPNRHVFFAVDDPSDIARFREALMHAAVRHDCSWTIVGQAGQRLRRYIFDANTFSPERLVYEGKPRLLDGLTQDRESPRFIKGSTVDTSKLQALTKAEQRDLAIRKGIAPRPVQNEDTGGVRYEFRLDNSGERRPLLRKDTRFVRADARSDVLCIQDFLDSGDEQWRIISEFRCELDEVSYKRSVSEVLLRGRDGESCVLYEHDGGITYHFPQTERIRDFFSKRLTHAPKGKLRAEAQERSAQTDGGGFIPREVELSEESLRPGSVHLLFGSPGQGKSRVATKLARVGKAVLFACASNEQAEDQFHKCSHASKTLVLSRPYRLKRDHGIEVAWHTGGNPFDAPEPDEQVTLERLVAAGVASSLEHAQDIWDAYAAGNDRPPLEEGTILFTTFERARIWGKAKHFRIRGDSDPVARRKIENTVLFVDDVDRQSISDHRLITDDVDEWMNRIKARTGCQFETLSTAKGKRYLLRPRSHGVLHGYRDVATVFTTVEQRTRIMLERSFRHELQIHDFSPEGKDPRTKLYLVGTPLVRSKYQGLFHPLRDVWTRQGLHWLWIGNGVDALENHYTIRGKNGYESSDTIAKISQPHPDDADKVALDLGLEPGNVHIATACTMLDQLNQAVGRNQGERFRARRCVALVDPQYLQVLAESSAYTAQVVANISEISPRAVHDPDVRLLLKTIKHPLSACRENLPDGLGGWLQSPPGVVHGPAVLSAHEAYSQLLQARQARRRRHLTHLAEAVAKHALGGKAWSQAATAHNLYRTLGTALVRELGHEVQLCLRMKSLVGDAVEFVRSGRGTLRDFEKHRRPERKLKNKELLAEFRQRVKSALDG